MLEISRSGNKLKVHAEEPGTGLRGFTVMAKDALEASRAVLHYYNESCGGPDYCPFCRSIEKEGA